MFSSRQYHAKAAEYAKRSSKATQPNEILEYTNLRKRYAELADNEEWVERNFSKTVHPPGRESGAEAEDERTLRCLGAAVILHWNNTPRKLQRELFDSAGAMGDLLKTRELRAQIARFLHDHKNDRSSDATPSGRLPPKSDVQPSGGREITTRR